MDAFQCNLSPPQQRYSSSIKYGLTVLHRGFAARCKNMSPSHPLIQMDPGKKHSSNAVPRPEMKLVLSRPDLKKSWQILSQGAGPQQRKMRKSYLCLQFYWNCNQISW